jgi:ubiquinone/menaquinone biosynthesis C-methylase UbiE
MKLSKFKEFKDFYNHWATQAEGDQSNWADSGSPHYWRYQSYLDLLKNYLASNKKILDVGCGQGNLLQQIGIGQLYGIDISKKYIDDAQKKIPNGTFVESNSDVLPFADNFFDIVICTEFLEHVPNPEKYVTEIYRVTKKGGLALFSTFNHWNISNILTLKPLRHIYCSSDHLREYNYFSFKKLLSQKFNTIKYQGSSASKSFQKYLPIHKSTLIKDNFPILTFLTFLSQK